ncbi:MAG: hypothetical protein ACK4NC_01250 [Candidatus Gracilibacteria bacterium]
MARWDSKKSNIKFGYPEQPKKKARPWKAKDIPITYTDIWISCSANEKDEASKEKVAQVIHKLKEYVNQKVSNIRNTSLKEYISTLKASIHSLLDTKKK